MTESNQNFLQMGEALEQQLSRIEDKLEDQINKILDLSRAGTVFTSLLDLNLILPMVMETALRIVKGEVGEVVIFDVNGQPMTADWGLSLKIIKQITDESGRNIIDHVRDGGQTLVMNGLDFHSQAEAGTPPVSINSLIVAPLKSQTEVVGIISIANKENGQKFDDEDKFSLELLGSFAAVAVSNVKHHKDALARQKIEHELNLAEQVQSTLMPDHIKVFEKIEVYSYHHQAGHVGGDFFDIIDLGKGRYLIVVADVSDKGIPAALIMTTVRSYIRIMSRDMTSLAGLVSVLNKLACQDIGKLGSMFVTMFLALVDMASHELRTVNAGHPPGLLIQNGRPIKLKTGGPFIGQFPDLEFQEKPDHINPGDKLLIFTDGIFECVNSRHEMLGLANVIQFLQENTHQTWDDFEAALKMLLKEYSFDTERVDDTTLLRVEFKK